MYKEQLVQVLYEFNKDLKGCIEQATKDISYSKDVLAVNIKHNKNKENIENEIDDLETTLRTLEQIDEIFDNNLRENDVDINDIIEYCED